jgi:L-rhamnose mutarotase
MQRVAFKMKLFKGFEDEYKKRHDEIWSDLQRLLKRNGITNYSIFLDEDTGDLFASFAIDDARKLDELIDETVMKKWWSYMKDIMETNEDNSPVTIPLKEVFYLE